MRLFTYVVAITYLTFENVISSTLHEGFAVVQAHRDDDAVKMVEEMFNRSSIEATLLSATAVLADFVLTEAA
jgi:hypothetical protein